MSSKEFPPRYWMAVRKSGAISEVCSGGTDTEGPLMLPPCSNQDMPQWIRYLSLSESDAIVSDLEKKLADAKEVIQKIKDAKCPSYVAHPQSVWFEEHVISVARDYFEGEKL
jgi:hypothetical protein